VPGAGGSEPVTTVAATATGPAPEPAVRRRRTSPRLRIGVATVTIVAILILLFAVPWWTLALAGAGWPSPVVAVATIGFAGGLAALPALMVLGHRSRPRDWAARAGDTLLGVIWVLFAWAVLGNVLLRPALAVAGVDDPARSRLVAGSVAAVSAVLLLWGYAEAMRVPRVTRVTVPISRLGADLDGLRVVLLTDTHYGPIDRARWSAKVVEVVNTLDPDLVCHTGDIADGGVDRRRAQAAPLAGVRARLARVYVTGNHEYFGATGQAQEWLDHLRALGWEPLHNRHLTVRRGGDSLVVAGVDDATAAASGHPGHRADHAAALAGADPALPVLLLAHQPKQVGAAIAHGVDLQLSGHTHGGQIWPFHLLVRLDQPVLRGLTRHGDRTWLYTSRGTGFWGPPLRIFAPSEITLLTLRVSDQSWI
jgi:predicted MPP superfamily phosphohydrolase